MAHYAEIDKDNTVLRVIVVSNHELLDGNGQENETAGKLFCQQLYGGNWVQTSYNGNIRKRYAGIGFVYDETLDAFIPPRPYPSWSLGQESCDWTPPVPMPVEGAWIWDEETLSWQEINLPPV